MGDLIGLGLLAVEVALLSIAARSLEIPVWGWVLVYVVMALIAVFAWHSEKWPKGSREVLRGVLGSIFFGGLFFAIDLVVGAIFHPDVPLLKAATSSRSMFGIATTVMVCPGVTIIFLACYFRSIFLEEQGST